MQGGVRGRGQKEGRQNRFLLFFFGFSFVSGILKGFLFLRVFFVFPLGFFTVSFLWDSFSGFLLGRFSFSEKKELGFLRKFFWVSELGLFLKDFFTGFLLSRFHWVFPFFRDHWVFSFSSGISVFLGR